MGDKLFIKQKQVDAEIILGIDLENEYDIFDENGNIKGHAKEDVRKQHKFILRRKFLNLHITDSGGKNILSLHSSSSFPILRRFDIMNSAGKILARAQTKPTTYRRNVAVFDSDWKLLLECKTKSFHPWTFKVIKDGKEIALITKKWSNFKREFFSQADNFQVDFRDVKDKKLRDIILALVFVIDLSFFQWSYPKRKKKALKT